LATALDTLREQVSGLAGVVPEWADPTQVDAWLASFRRLEGAVAGLRTRLIGCVQNSQAHQGGGHAAPTHYLKEALGVSGREAARQDKLARDLRGLPRTQQALTAGEIGPEQAQAIGRSARRGVLGDADLTESQLLPLARDRGAEDLSQRIRRLEQEADRTSLESAERRNHRRRRASLARRRDGMWDLRALLTDENGEALATALDALRTFDPPGTPIPQQRSPEQRTADAIAGLVTTATRSGTTPTSGGVLPQLNVVVPLEALDPDGTAVGELAHGGVLSAGAIERLLCDANLRRLITRGDSEVLDVGRTRRQWSVAQRQALRVRDGGCRGPGCDRPVAWTHAHHLVPWSDNGPTAVDNGLLLCSFHHHQVHEGGWTVSLDTTTGHAEFTSPTGRHVTTQPHRPGGPRHSGIGPAPGTGADAEPSPPRDVTPSAARADATPSARRDVHASASPHMEPSGPAQTPTSPHRAGPNSATAPAGARRPPPGATRRPHPPRPHTPVDTDDHDADRGPNSPRDPGDAGGPNSPRGPEDAGDVESARGPEDADNPNARDPKSSQETGTRSAATPYTSQPSQHRASPPRPPHPVAMTLDLNCSPRYEPARPHREGAAASPETAAGRSPP